MKLSFIELKNKASIFPAILFLSIYFERYTEVRQFFSGHPQISIVFHLPIKQSDKHCGWGDAMTLQCHPYFTNEETQIWGDTAACPRSHS